MPPPSGLRGVQPEKNKPTYLSFDLLEDVMNLPTSRYEEIVRQATVLRIGPLVEYAYHHYECSAEQLGRLADHHTPTLDYYWAIGSGYAQPSLKGLIRPQRL